MSCVRPSGRAPPVRPSVLRGKNCNVGHYSIYTQTVQQLFFFTRAMLIGAIDFYHFIPFSLVLALAGVTRSVQIKSS